MVARFGFASLIPPGLEVDSVDGDGDTLIVTARSRAVAAACPVCGVACAVFKVTTSATLRIYHARADVCACGCSFDGSGAACRDASARYLPSGSVRRCCLSGPGAQGGWRRSSTTSVWPWAAGPVLGLPGGSCCRSATTPCSASCVDTPCRGPSR